MAARWLLVGVIACRSSEDHASPSPPPPAPALAPVVRASQPDASLPPKPPNAPFTVALARIATPAGDINAPEYVARFTADLRAAAEKHARIVAIADPNAGCWGDDTHCAAEAGLRAGADVVVYGTLVHSTEGDRTDIHLEAVVVSSLAHRSWDEAPLDSEQFFADAAARAYATLVTATP